MEILKDQIVDFFSKIWIWVFYIGISIIGKISSEILRGRKLTWLQVFAIIGCACFVGTCASFWCAIHYPEQGAFIVPVSTLLSREIVSAIVSLDYKKLASEIAQHFADRLKK